MNAARRPPHAAARRTRPPRIAEDRTPPPPIVERPDGFYWLGEGGLGEFGPFGSHELAQADRDAGTEGTPVPSQALLEAEIAIGMAPWPQPLAGAPAEGVSAPRLQEE